MRENILYFIWQQQYFSFSDAKTITGESIQVIHPGFHNINSGPDFEQAKIRIGEVEWNGDVEIHVGSLDWTSHGHQHDKAYNKVILHVVWEHNGEVFRNDGTALPTLELKNLVDKGLLNRVRALIESIDAIPCSTQINKVSHITILETVHRALIKRLERKAQIVLQELFMSHGDWSETAYRLLMRQMGMKVNGEAFFELAEALPYHLIRKHKHNLIHLEALLFGVSGLLVAPKEDGYLAQLKKEFDFLSHKYGLKKQLSPEQWKFMRLRPANFPTLRIAQMASILSNPADIFEMLTEFADTKELTLHLKIKTSEYWQTHYRFKVEANRNVPSLGKTSEELILLNVVAPLLAAYSIHLADNKYMEKAVSIMEGLKPENNRIIKQWSQLGISPASGAESQGLIELYNEHCQQKACLSCSIGFKILNYKS